MRHVCGILTPLLAVTLVVSACATDRVDPTGPGVAAAILTDEGVTPSAPASFGLATGDVSIAQALQLEGFPCSLGPAGITLDSKAVITPSGNVLLVCRGQTATGPAETLVLDDVPCGTPGGLTVESHFVYTTSGEATLTCQFKG